MLILLGIGLLAFGWILWSYYAAAPSEEPQVETTPATDRDASAPSPAMQRRMKRVQERIDDMMPRPDERPRHGLERVAEAMHKPAPDQVVLRLARGGTVTLDGTTYALGDADQATATEAADALRAALAKHQASRGGDSFREADGRSRITLLLGGQGAQDKDDLHRLLQVVGKAPLRIYRVEFDLATGDGR